VRVVSPLEGPMRRLFTEAGMPVEIVDLAATLKTESPKDFHAALAIATAGLPWPETDLVICNTMVSFWAVAAAQRAGLPVLMYVHESAHIRRFFAPSVSPALIPLIESAFREASHVVFTAESSRAVFTYLGDRGNFVSLPSWVDVARVDAFAAAHTKAALRRKHGLDPDAVLIVNIGSICERKGQHIFIRAIELLQSELPGAYPGKKIQFVMVGARPGVYLELLKHDVAFHRLDNVVFLPESGEIFDFYRLADIFVCTSFEESFPRVLLESAAFRLPIITTNVNGIAEMLAADEAWIIPPGDRYQLAEVTKQALNAHFNQDTRRADQARASVVRRYHEANSLPLHAALARACAARPASP
jgi:glycosyltransferase involved in cell wall biosynthesis